MKEENDLSDASRQLPTVFRNKPTTSSSTARSATEPASHPQEQATTAQPLLQPPQGYVTDESSKPDTDEHRQTSSQSQTATSTILPTDQAIAVNPTIEHETISSSTTPQNTTMAPTRTDVDKRVFNARDSLIAAGIELADADLIIPPSTRNRVPYERVHKRTRMRVRYTCHLCATVYGHDRVCVFCEHRRCSQCTRYPAKRAPRYHDVKRLEAVESAMHAEAVEDSEPKFCDCHECQTVVEIRLEECPNCHHKICERCLRESQSTVSGNQTTAVDPTSTWAEVQTSIERQPLDNTTAS